MRIRRYRRELALSFVLALVVAQGRAPFAQPAEGRWRGPDGRPLPFVTDQDALEFLRRARVVGMKRLSTGKNRPYKVRLVHDGGPGPPVEANAIFRSVDIRERRVKLDGRIYPDFHDSYIYECAAYELARVLGIDNVPPCVQRMVDLESGSLQLWVEGATMEIDRREKLGEPKEAVRWMRQKQKMRLFDALIYNFDRNQTNMLIDADWKLWFVDHTRSFRKFAKIERIEKIIWCERDLWERLQALDREQLSRVKKYTSGPQVSALLKRRDLLVDHLRSLIDAHGEDRVIYDAVSPATEGWAEEADDDIPEGRPEPMLPDDRS